MDPEMAEGCLLAYKLSAQAVGYAFLEPDPPEPAWVGSIAHPDLRSQI